MEQKEIYLLIISASVTALVFCITLVTLFVLLQKRKESYQKEITLSRIEVKEQTLKNISWEIHDNIGQILSTLNLYGYKILGSSPENLKPEVEEMQELIQIAITEVRSLSKALNSDYIKNVGLIKSTQLELERFERLNYLKTQCTIEGNPFIISDDSEIIMLRILQEFFSNSIKHARATEMSVSFTFTENVLKIIAKDNGVGYDEKSTFGTGIINMKNRAKLIGAFLKLDSAINEGTQIKLSYRNKNIV